MVIYLWAMRTKLPRDEMLLLVNKQGESELPPRPHRTDPRHAAKPWVAPSHDGAHLGLCRKRDRGVAPGPFG